MPEILYADGIRSKCQLTTMAKEIYTDVADPQSDERAREHAPAGLIYLGAVKTSSFSSL